jgi:hypothetical protein
MKKTSKILLALSLPRIAIALCVGVALPMAAQAQYTGGPGRSMDRDARVLEAGEACELILSVDLLHAGGQGLWVHPNPADEMLYVGLPALPGTGHWLGLHDAAGREVLRLPLPPSAPRTIEFPLVGLATGVYQLTLHDGRGGRPTWTKIMKR